MAEKMTRIEEIAVECVRQGMMSMLESVAVVSAVQYAASLRLKDEDEFAYLYGRLTNRQIARLDDEVS